MSQQRAVLWALLALLALNMAWAQGNMCIDEDDLIPAHIPFASHDADTRTCESISNHIAESMSEHGGWSSPTLCTDLPTMHMAGEASHWDIFSNPSGAAGCCGSWEKARCEWAEQSQSSQDYKQLTLETFEAAPQWLAERRVNVKWKPLSVEGPEGFSVIHLSP